MTLSKMREWHNVDIASFERDIRPREEPAVIRGLVGHWPAVQAGLNSPQALCDYLKHYDAGRAVRTLIGPASIGGRFFYKDDLSGLNFERREEPFRTALDGLLAHLHDEDPPAIAIQAASSADHLPGFARENENPLLNAAVTPRLWIGNATTVATHFDPLENIACVAAGRRRFTLFPPDQVSNLYIGPFELTPAGAPVSMVSVTAPEFDRYPRFRDALASALVAELEPGDAIYIPYLWWHHVESLERFNVLVNYWWNDAPAGLGAPRQHLPRHAGDQRAAAGTAQGVARAVRSLRLQVGGEPAAHLSPEKQGIAAPMTQDLARQMKAMLLNTLTRGCTVNPLVRPEVNRARSLPGITARSCAQPGSAAGWSRFVSRNLVREGPFEVQSNACLTQGVFSGPAVFHVEQDFVVADGGGGSMPVAFIQMLALLPKPGTAAVVNAMAAIRDARRNVMPFSFPAALQLLAIENKLRCRAFKISYAESRSG